MADTGPGTLGAVAGQRRSVLSRAATGSALGASDCRPGQRQDTRVHARPRQRGAACRMQQRAGSGATVGTVTIAAYASGWHAAHVTGFTVTIPLVSGGRQLTVTSTEVAFVRGTEVHQLTFNGNGAAFPASLQARLVQAAQHRH